MKGIKQPRIEHPAHLKFIRQLPCLVTGQDGVEAAHIRYASARWDKRFTGMAEKPHDMWVVPLSPETHREQHDMDERAFWSVVNIDPLPIAVGLYAIHALPVDPHRRLDMGRALVQRGTIGMHPYARSEQSVAS